MTIVITKGDNPGNYIYVDVNADFATPVTDVSAEYRLPMYLLSSISRRCLSIVSLSLSISTSYL
jgi:hypothetical protein